MPITYGALRCKCVSNSRLQSSRKKNELQYHLHASFSLGNGAPWDCAINVGTNDADDLLQYKLVYDFDHPIVATLRGLNPGFEDLTDTSALPALDFLRSDILKGTGPWRPTDVMDGSDQAEPIPSLTRMLQNAQANKSDVWIFGRLYDTGDGIHDIHMNQGSTGSYINNGQDSDHNMIWQDGAVIVDTGAPQLAAYFTVFTQQLVPTDNLGNPVDGAHGYTIADDGSLVGT
ncbi:MAG: DUF2278 family protein [Acidobacteriaceae bacterium]|nr:DUF2278 family protein [Acidobacteriaceae bacterium]